MDTPNKMTLALLAATTLVVAACGGGSGGSMTPPPSNSAPAVSTIGDRSADQDTPVSIDFGIDDRESGAGSLMVSAAADGTALFPTDGVVLSGSGTARTLTLTPLEATTGTANIAIRVADPDGAVTTRNFVVAVNAKNNSIKAMALDTFAKAENDVPTTLNGWTIQQDADDPATFAALIPAEEP
ncbi:MAG TPA: hypothetical protein VJP84_16485 [Steroidobacteraceae bacterium]|jgi:hypothetical protein|nr:hypothetical protein [Steroidobacteraceae bacterium]